MKRPICILSALLGLAGSVAAQSNLLRNPGFETVPNADRGQGILPSEWLNVRASADTYSNDGSYGLGPATGGNFFEVTANEGIRWVAGWALVQETFGQELSTPLVGGVGYELSAALIQAKRSDLDVKGGYEVYLAKSYQDAFSSPVLLGRLGPTTDSYAWEVASLSFTAPADANQLNFLYFSPYSESTTIGVAYPGLDSLTLSSTRVAGVPEQSSGLILMGLSLGGLAWVERRRRA